ncbi:17875_t:CDS:1, partial [Funneliformis caledonium]
MPFSKIFSGDLPELTFYVIKYLRNDLKSLYSCILVNRFLCRMTIPILWEKPFALKCLNGKRFDFLEVYFSFFSELDRNQLIKFGVKFKRISTPLFIYPSFIKSLDTYRMELHAINWANNLDADITSSPSTIKVEPDDITFLDIGKEVEIGYNDIRLKKFVDMICSLLLKSFMINNASLKDFNLKITTSHGLFLPKFFQLIFNNTTFVSNVEKFSIGFIANPNVSKFSQLESLLTSLPSSLPFVKHFHISYLSRSKVLKNETKSRTHILSLKISLDAFNFYNNHLTSIEFN